MLLDDLIDFAASPRPTTLRPLTLQAAQNRVLDYLGVALGGTTAPESHRVWIAGPPGHARATGCQVCRVGLHGRPRRAGSGTGRSIAHGGGAG